MRIKIYTGIIIVCAILGILNASFVYYKDQSGGPLPCFVVSGCDAVQSSPYSHLFGISLSLWGVGYYVILMIVTICIVNPKSKIQNLKPEISKYILNGFILWVWFGFLFSLYLLVLQLFVIHALCSSCLVSLIDTVIVAACGTIAWRRIGGTL